ncbi:MAG: hypothetical protein FWE03_02470 [Firmicutes bacterium]|nr:hypothetical protein [Bacillota bacterium]
MFYTSSYHKYLDIDLEYTTIINVACDTEWNAAIVNVAAVLNDGYYKFSVEVASFNKDTYLTIEFAVFDYIFYLTEYVYKEILAIKKIVWLKYNQSKIIIFDDTKIVSFNHVQASIIDAQDSFKYDNYFIFFANQQELRVLYITPNPNILLNPIFLSLIWSANNWNVHFETITLNSAQSLNGFDIYIFENEMPNILPNDGIVWLINPDIAPKNSGLVFGEKIYAPSVLDYFNISASNEGKMHPLLYDYHVPDVFIRGFFPLSYVRIVEHDGFVPLTFINDSPVKLINHDRGIVVFAFECMAAGTSFRTPEFLYNIVSYFLAPMIEGAVFEVGDEVFINVNEGAVVYVENLKMQNRVRVDEYTFKIVLNGIGSFRLVKTLLSGRVIVQNFFIRVPIHESMLFGV